MDLLPALILNGETSSIKLLFALLSATFPPLTDLTCCLCIELAKDSGAWAQNLISYV